MAEHLYNSSGDREVVAEKSKNNIIEKSNISELELYGGSMNKEVIKYASICKIIKEDSLTLSGDIDGWFGLVWTVNLWSSFSSLKDWTNGLRNTLLIKRISDPR